MSDRARQQACSRYRYRSQTRPTPAPTTATTTQTTEEVAADCTVAAMEEVPGGARVGPAPGQTVSQPHVPALVPPQGVPPAAVRILGGSVSPNLEEQGAGTPKNANLNSPLPTPQPKPAKYP